MTTATIVTTLTTVTTVTIKTTVTTMMTATIVSRARIATAGTTVISTFSLKFRITFALNFLLGIIVVPKQIVEQCLEAKKLLKGVFTDLTCLYGYLLKKGFTEKFSTQKTCMENKMAAV